MVNVLPFVSAAGGVMISLSPSRATLAAGWPPTVTDVTVSPRKSRLNSDRSWVAFAVIVVVDVIEFATGS